MLVVDASVVVSAVGFDGLLAVASRAIVARNDIAAPDLVRIEAMSVLRRRFLAGHITCEQVEAALAGLLDLRIEVFPNALLLQRSWELRDNLSTNDASYVALAEALGCPVATADRRLANAPGSRCEFIVVEPPGIE